MIKAKQLPFYTFSYFFSFFSFSQISIDRLNEVKVAGLTIFLNQVTPGTPSYIRIRGNGSILGNNSPLFIVDGIPYENFNIGANPRFPGLICYLL